jgi:hypothetical protein
MPEVYDDSTISGLEAYKRMPNAMHIRMITDSILHLSGFCIFAVAGNPFDIKNLKVNCFCIANASVFY